MGINRRQFACLSAATIGSGVVASAAPASATVMTSDEAIEHVARNVEAFRQAMVDADPITLLTLADDDLSFGHSNGLIQTKHECIDSVVSGQEDFRSLELSEKSTSSNGEYAIQRHIFTADILLKGEPLFVTLKVLEVWRRAQRDWRLIARQAYKV